MERCTETLTPRRSKRQYIGALWAQDETLLSYMGDGWMIKLYVRCGSDGMQNLVHIFIGKNWIGIEM